MRQQPGELRKKGQHDHTACCPHQQITERQAARGRRAGLEQRRQGAAADRALRYAAIVGRENVIAGTDCGLGGRVHGDLAWAKLRVLAEGARLASKSLWP